jgi:type I restriction-modification system DNA methylase subunit
MNAWRTFAVKLSSSSKKVGTKEHTVTRKEDGKTFTDKTVEDIFKKPETNDSLEFLKRIIEIINKHPANEEAGFRAVVEYFEAAGVPKMPSEETIRFIEDEVLNFRQWYAIVATLPARASAAAENANKRIDRKDEERSRKLGGGIVNFLKKLI